MVRGTRIDDPMVRVSDLEETPDLSSDEEVLTVGKRHSPNYRRPEESNGEGYTSEA